MKISLIVTMTVGLLAGCAAVWGKPYKVEFQNSSSITISFDPALANMGEVQNVAQAHCDKYRKDAFPGAWQNSPWALRSMSFICRART